MKIATYIGHLFLLHTVCFIKNLPQRLIGFTALLIGLSSCKEVQQISDIITKPTPRELYARDYDNNLDYLKWHASYQTALHDSLYIELPYAEVGIFSDENLPVYSYDVHLERGEKVMVKMTSDSTFAFLDIYSYKSADSLKNKPILSEKLSNETSIAMPVEQSEKYKILIQPQLYAFSTFKIEIYTQPSLKFPVAGFSDRAIQSFWGNPRSGGTRLHEGIDIFAPRLTPVVAVTDGHISFTGERGLGGKQVWLRDGIFGASYYYAHLDSIKTTTTNKVSVGDTLGFVGNTGNAKTTAPHLHFGIYTSKGAIDPLPFVRTRERKEMNINTPSDLGIITSQKANVRNEPNSNSLNLNTLKYQDTIQIMGRTRDWYHAILDNGSKGFIHKSLIKEVDNGVEQSL